MNTEISDINRLINLYIRRLETPEQNAAVREYLIDDTSRFDILLEAMRAQAMQELGIDMTDDFLPAHLQKCAPEAFSMCSAFRKRDKKQVSAFIQPSAPQRSTFEVLKARLIDSDTDALPEVNDITE